ncbi:peptidoglycan-binding protein [Pseudomaricurvus alcaniphilus]|uniref:peptidoglycan-binding protein n=1 Tax=Pseudomaricurvus alcaniphilus TaxID=1166482 RepID=UPI001409AC58|nr:peptidoglycan-binding domain-containing protein [Pseudomaricurvus alcaniphilus]NHN37903.1 peptidoglycan-binding protein [Pseudomaricurvus alcaniphilus]
MADTELDWLQRWSDGMDAAVSQRYLPDPGAECHKFKSPNESDSVAYIRALRGRLIELGYLAESAGNRSSAAVDKEFMAAVRHFQADARIEQDGWAGPQTWRVLECLVSFENQQNPLEWHRDWDQVEEVLANPAVTRAVYCRLYTLGFFEDWKRDKLGVHSVMSAGQQLSLERALSRFGQFAMGLKLLQRPPQGLDFSLLCALFNHDAMLASLANHQIYDAVKLEFAPNIGAITRAELWMLGYDIAPGKDRVKWESVRAHKRTSRHRKKISQTSLAIRKFWRDNREELPGSVDQEQPCHELLATLHRLASELPEEGRQFEDVNRSVGEILADHESARTFKTQFGNIASGIFDGIKRAVKWLYRMVRKALAFSVEFIANIVRYIGKRARLFFVTVVKAVDVVRAGLGYLKNAVHSYAAEPQMVFTHDRDFDQYCLIEPALGAATIRAATAQHRVRSRFYVAGLQILSHVMRMVAGVVKAVHSPAGWVLALLSLSNLAESVGAIRHQVGLMEHYQLDLGHRRALFRVAVS